MSILTTALTATPSPENDGPGSAGRVAPADSDFGPLRVRYAAVREVIEFPVALALLVVAAPVIFVAGVLIKLTSRGPVLYSQTRLGRYGRPYTIYKLRTMGHECEKQSGPRWSTYGDPRITPVGRFLRCTHLDELPQLWNILRGEMSLIGPRPERPEFVSALEKSIPRYAERMLVKPGVTGLAQVQLPADTDLASVRRKLAYDLYYIREMSFGLDLRVLVGTGLKVFGIPFRVLGRLVRMPSRQAVEEAYQFTSAGLLSAAPRAQTA
ncbi:MAG TPA: sugar transferase [Gemmataceae bacterium]|nr:sugar transferase [Gemmataceae bacterium]